MPIHVHQTKKKESIHLINAREGYFQVLAIFASDSPAIKKQFIGAKNSPEPRVAIQVYLTLIHGYPEEFSHQDKLIELVKSDVESKHTTCLGILRTWPYPITPLHPVFIELVQSSKKPDEYLEMIRLLRTRGMDLNPMIPQLQSLRYSSPFESELCEFGFYSVRKRDSNAMAL